ncbi:MAG: hypothetical protein ALECFALPRED_010145 [Alectoria fallacina]|uniref:Methyltransferase type 11 domain-containing protein n=1 Tax=Alectoria fallacina TaxID=1903189 RepID=A0A8H3PK24_9LECA|nr:MAG: hypothetical protein ALECFALPRED_010145 [Alectoria fallacina]
MPVYELQRPPHESSSNDAHQSQPSQGKDHWTANAYSASASFVPLLTQEIVQWLDPQPHDTILDLGCGDGLLTAKIRSSCSRIAGFDASTNLIEAAQNTYGTDEGLTWNVLDCRYLEESKAIKEGEFSKVFSNAALHWILRDASTRLSVFRGTYQALQPGGTFVFEMGGAGNVADVHTALLAALVHQGVAIEKAREACPWFFPSEKSVKDMLEEAGFQVEKMKLDYRPTKLTTEEEGGLEGWVRLMGANFLDVLPTKDQKEAVVREVCDVLQTVLSHEEDGSMWLGYVRLKAVARK